MTERAWNSTERWPTSKDYYQSDDYRDGIEASRELGFSPSLLPGLAMSDRVYPDLEAHDLILRFWREHRNG